MDDYIWVTEIQHKHGHDTYLNKTREGAMRKLYGYVKDNWWREDECPENQDEAIDKYFDGNEEEYYTQDTLGIGD